MYQMTVTMYFFYHTLRLPWGVHEVHLCKLLTLYHLSKFITDLCDCANKGTISIHSRRFVMALLQWHNVYKLVEDELPDP